ncbi:metallophosphoesterase [Oleiharenicola lentus]|uniref:metallophosphoesterase n=1 Tax=Oleiharenicola lentus TaxID=2508720 RepID=UPI0013E94B06|nr:metallophosphoesterase [Oleiharenicola lentus]
MIRILSDLHCYDARTLVRDFQQLLPLLEGVPELVLNGDSCEMRRDVSPAMVEALRNFFRQRVPAVTFITGNHDPDISDTHELLLAKDRIWVTHGDIFLDGLTPWSRHAGQLRRLLAAERAADPSADFALPAVRLRLARAVARAEEDLPDYVTGGWRAHLKWIARTFFPPRQVLAMLRAWRDLPSLAARLAVAQRSSTQVVVTGHVHFPGVWRHSGGPTIINTGSFFQPLGGNLVDIFADRVEVRRIRRCGSDFAPGALLATIPLHLSGSRT